MAYWAFRLGRMLAQSLPLRIVYAAAEVLSAVAWLVMPVQRENAIDNMAQVLGKHRGDPQVRLKARESFKYYSLYMADFLRMPRVDWDRIDSQFTFNDWDKLEDALAGGKGVIFATAHMGNWDVGAAAFAQRFPVSAVTDTFHPKKMNDLVQGHRTGAGMKVIPVEMAARRIIGALRRNEILGLVVDIPTPENGVEVEFFGGLSRVPAGAALLALKTGARLVSGVVVRNPDHTYTGMVNSHLDVELTGDLTTDVRILTQRMMESLEGFIRQYPEQWFIFRPMWAKDGSLGTSS